jgi:hypothetical protein
LEHKTTNNKSFLAAPNALLLSISVCPSLCLCSSFTHTQETSCSAFMFGGNFRQIWIFRTRPKFARFRRIISFYFILFPNRHIFMILSCFSVGSQEYKRILFILLFYIHI